MTLTETFLSPIAALTGILYPSIPRKSDSRMTRASRWLVHGIMWTAVIAMLWQWERSLQMDRWLRSPLPDAHRHYLVIVAAAVYAIGWLARGMWNALRADETPESDDDLADAWADAREIIELAGICTATTPTYVCPGAPSPTMINIFGQWGLRATSPKSNLPFHVFANHDAIIVTTDRLSNLATTRLRNAKATGDFGSGERDESANRMEHLCRLIATRCEQPAVQGVLVVLPWEGTNGETSTRAAIEACQADLSIIRETLELDLPVHFAIVGANGIAGREISAFQAFPSIPDLDPADIPAMWKEGIDRLCLETLPVQIMKQANPDALSAEGHGNYDLLSELHARRSRWVRLLAEGASHHDGEQGMVAGIGLLSNVSEDATAAQVAQSLWNDLLSASQSASWNAKAIARANAEARNSRWRLGISSIVVVLALALSAWIMFGRIG